jgi:predicted Zn-dependent peptidase
MNSPGQRSTVDAIRPHRSKLPYVSGKQDVTQSIHAHTFENGLVLVAETMPWLESAAFSLVVPAGCSMDPVDRQGLGNFVSEMVQRGCGPRDSRQFVNDLERLGADRSSSISNAHCSFGAAVLAENLPAVLAIHADLVRSPHLPSEQLEDARQVCLHEIRAVEDDPAQKVMHLLRERHYPDPWGRPSHGHQPSLEQITLAEIREFFQRYYTPRGAILSVAGNVDWAHLKDHVGQTMADWSASDPPWPKERPSDRRQCHVGHPSSQTHIGIAYDSVPYGHPDYFQARGAVGVLSDGVSSRLFTEVREKRGLCYAVFASCHSLRDRGAVLCYAGTSTERAQETLDVVAGELARLSEGIDAEELDRLKARIKSALIMQQESSSARSSSIAADWYFLGRVQSIDEIGRIVDGLTCDSINRYLHENPPGDFTIVTLGAEPLEVPRAIS